MSYHNQPTQKTIIQYTRELLELDIETYNKNNFQIIIQSIMNLMRTDIGNPFSCITLTLKQK